jgi:hypothetical protein
MRLRNRVLFPQFNPIRDHTLLRLHAGSPCFIVHIWSLPQGLRVIAS